MLIHVRRLVNSFHVTVRVPPEILGMIPSYLTEDDLFSASQVCHYWRSVLISSPSLWTRVSCDDVSRASTSLERCRSRPIQLQLKSSFSTTALEEVILQGNVITSLTISREPDWTPLLHQLFAFSRPSVERLHVYSEMAERRRDEEQIVHGIWQDLPSLRELFVRRYYTPIDQLTAPNLVHLAMEHTKCSRIVTVQSILNTLRESPLLETLLIVQANIVAHDTAHHPSPVCLAHLNSIELGVVEVRSGLTTYLQFPPNAAVGFREMGLSDVCGDIPPVVMAAMHHVLGRIVIRCITLAAPTYNDVWLLVRFEGQKGSLEISTDSVHSHKQIWTFLFGPEGVLSHHSPRIRNVKELHIVDCPFEDGRGLHYVSAAMPNLVSISVFRCNGPRIFELLAPTNLSSPPFPHLERITVLGSESGLERMARTRRDCGVPLKTLVVGRDSRGFKYGHLEDYAALGELVDDLHVGCPTEVLRWAARNEIFNIRSTAEAPGPVSPYGNLKALG